MISVDAYLWMLENQHKYTDPVDMAQACTEAFKLVTKEDSVHGTPIELIRFAASVIADTPM